MSGKIVVRDYGAKGTLHFIHASSTDLANTRTIVAFTSQERAEEGIARILNGGGQVSETAHFAHHFALDLPYDTALGFLDLSEVYE